MIAVSKEIKLNLKNFAYPILLQHTLTDVVVLFTSETAGTIIKVSGDQNASPVGFHETDWTPVTDRNWVIYPHAIELRNK